MKTDAKLTCPRKSCQHYGKPRLTRAGPHLKATCARCGAYLRFLKQAHGPHQNKPAYLEDRKPASKAIHRPDLVAAYNTRSVPKTPPDHLEWKPSRFLLNETSEQALLSLSIWHKVTALLRLEAKDAFASKASAPYATRAPSLPRRQIRPAAG